MRSYGTSHTRMGCPIRVWDEIHVYGIEHAAIANTTTVNLSSQNTMQKITFGIDN